MVHDPAMLVITVLMINRITKTEIMPIASATAGWVPYILVFDNQLSKEMRENSRLSGPAV